MTIEGYDELNYKDLGTIPPVTALGRITELFDPPGLFHVGQREWPQGNCYEHHIRLGETPCTSLEQCESNNEVRAERHRLNNSIRRRPRFTEKQKKELERWKKEQLKVEDLIWRLY
jgi:hypothetical protein